LYAPAALDGAYAPAGAALSAHDHLVTAIVYLRRSQALAFTVSPSPHELATQAGAALRHARAATASGPAATIAALRTLHAVITFCQRHGVTDAADGEDLGALLDRAVADLHVAVMAAPRLSWPALAALRTTVVRHHLYETGDIEQGVRLAETYARRLRSLPDTPATDPEPPRRLFAEDWVGYLGHLCLFDYYIKAKILGAMRWDRLTVAALPHMRIANRALLDRWRPWIDPAARSTGSAGRPTARVRARPRGGLPP
jgi:hypothetical protein